MKGVTTKGLGQFLFQRLRDKDENFPMNLSEFEGAEILLVEDNFGCGSSREHAAWALKDYGIKAIIAPSFADIFKTNALKNGIILIEFSQKIVEAIFENESELEIDLEKQKVVFSNGKTIKFEIDAYRKHCILKNMNDLDYLLSKIENIKNFDKQRKEKLFFNI